MKISQHFKVVLESSDGNATLTFKRGKLNDILDAAAKGDAIEDKAAKIRFEFDQVLKHLVSVEGLEHEDGTLVSTDEIRELGLDPKTVLAIVTAYNMAVNPQAESAEKKS